MSFFTDATAASVTTGQTATQNTTAIQTVLDTGKHCYIPRGGPYSINPGILFKAEGQRLYGPGQLSASLRPVGSGTFVSTNGQNGCRIEGLRFWGYNNDASLSMSGGYVIAVDGRPVYGGSALQSARTDIYDIEITAATGGVYISDHVELKIEDVHMATMRGPGVFAEALTTNDRIDVISISQMSYDGHPSSGSSKIAVLIDGCVHTINLWEVRAVAAESGVVVRNTADLPYGEHASFLFGRGVEIDFPTGNGIYMTHCDRARFTDLYVHGSTTANGLEILSGVRDTKIIGANITGHALSGLRFGGYILDLVAGEFEWNVTHDIYLLGCSNNVRVTAGGAAGDGITRIGSGTSVIISNFQGAYTDAS